MKDYITSVVDFMKYCVEKHGLITTVMCIVLILLSWQAPELITAVRWW